ncbi:MAG TPA: arylesterase [Gemmatimonadaceae bacterium]|nr:arylesterase [Gemmatimonadaceae bacterium]
MNGRGSRVAGRRSWVGAALAVVLACARQADSGSSQTTRADTGAPSAHATKDLQAATSPGRRTILFIGTSLTAGYGLDPDSAYPEMVQRMLDSAGLAYNVVNAGVSGETSSALLSRLDWLMRQAVDVVVIETGANDGLRGIPVETMARNVEETVTRVRASHPAARVVLVQMEAPPNLGDSYTRRFHGVFPEVAKRTGVILMPFLLQGVAGMPGLNQGDGIHPNDAGERIVARNVMKALRPLL